MWICPKCSRGYRGYGPPCEHCGPEGSDLQALIVVCVVVAVVYVTAFMMGWT